MKDDSKDVIYFEKSNWPISVWFFLSFICASIYLAIWAPLGQIPALITTILCTFGLVIISQKMQTTILLEQNMLYVNNAKIELRYIRKVTALDKVEFKKLNGAAADPAAFLATNFWSNTGVKIDLSDKNDPTPYWLVSSKRAKELAEKLS
ncbi:MAG: DUF3093 family protein [Actinobacteria bacterium]|nr:DUF3093 family protein [Actinomycetota bacterium]